MTILPLGSCTCLFMSNFTPLLLFGVNVELSSLLDRARAMAWFSQGPRVMMLL